MLLVLDHEWDGIEQGFVCAVVELDFVVPSTRNGAQLLVLVLVGQSFEFVFVLAADVLGDEVRAHSEHSTKQL